MALTRQQREDLVRRWRAARGGNPDPTRERWMRDNWSDEALIREVEGMESFARTVDDSPEDEPRGYGTEVRVSQPTDVRQEQASVLEVTPQGLRPRKARK